MPTALQKLAQNINKISSIQASGGAIAISVADFTKFKAVIAKFSANTTFQVNDAGASQVASLFKNNNITGITVKDNGANLGKNITSLTAAAAKINGITDTNIGTPGSIKISLQNYTAAKSALSTNTTLFGTAGTFALTSDAKSISNAVTVGSDASVKSIGIADSLTNIIANKGAINSALSSTKFIGNITVTGKAAVIAMSEDDYNHVGTGLKDQTKLLSELSTSLNGKLSITQADLAHSNAGGTLDLDANIKSISVSKTVTSANIAALSLSGPSALSSKVSALKLTAASSDLSSASGLGLSPLLNAVANLGQKVTGLVVTGLNPNDDLAVDIKGIATDKLTATLSTLAKLQDANGIQVGLKITGATFANIAKVQDDSQVNQAEISDTVSGLISSTGDVNAFYSSISSDVTMSLTDTAANAASNASTLSDLLNHNAKLHLNVNDTGAAISSSATQLALLGATGVDIQQTGVTGKNKIQLTAANVAGNEVALQGLLSHDANLKLEVTGSSTDIVSNIVGINAIQTAFNTQTDRISIALPTGSASTLTVTADSASASATDLNTFLNNNAALKLQVSDSGAKIFSNLTVLNTLQNTVNQNNGLSKISIASTDSANTINLNASDAADPTKKAALATLLGSNSTLQLKVSDTGANLTSGTNLDKINGLLTSLASSGVAASRVNIVQSDAATKHLVVSADQYVNDASAINSAVGQTDSLKAVVELYIGNLTSPSASTTAANTINITAINAGNGATATALNTLMTQYAGLNVAVSGSSADILANLTNINAMQKGVNENHGTLKIGVTGPSGSATTFALNATDVAGADNTKIVTLLTNNASLTLSVTDTGAKLTQGTNLDKINGLLTSLASSGVAVSRVNIVQSDAATNNLVVSVDQYENNEAALNVLTGQTTPSKIELDMGTVADVGIHGVGTDTVLTNAEDIGQIVGYNASTPVTPNADQTQGTDTFNDALHAPANTFKLKSNLLKNDKNFSDVLQFDLKITSTGARATSDYQALLGDGTPHTGDANILNLGSKLKINIQV